MEFWWHRFDDRKYGFAGGILRVKLIALRLGWLVLRFFCGLPGLLVAGGPSRCLRLDWRLSGLRRSSTLRGAGGGRFARSTLAGRKYAGCCFARVRGRRFRLPSFTCRTGSPEWSSPGAASSCNCCHVTPLHRLPRARGGFSESNRFWYSRLCAAVTGGSKSRLGSKIIAFFAGLKCPTPTAPATKQLANIGWTMSKGTMYFFALKTDSTTPRTGPLRRMPPGT